jgi:hypothetical protein
LKPQEENKFNSLCFTDFDGKFRARLAAVMPRFFGGAEESKLAGTSARYQLSHKSGIPKRLDGTAGGGHAPSSKKL